LLMGIHQVVLAISAAAGALDHSQSGLPTAV
jgi:hypothetical protein